MRIRMLLAALVVLGAAPASAGQEAFSRVAIDSTAAIDASVTESGDAATGVVMDAVATVAIGGGFEGIVRPWMQKLGNSSEWNRQIWLATLRYQHTGPVGVRVDAGLIGSPIGYANLMLRPDINPTISLPSSLFVPLPGLGAGAPRTTLLGVLYPYGVSTTVSSTAWDVRAAVIDTSPLRMRRVFGESRAPRFGTVVIGGGITPVVGLRIGGSVAHGGWMRAGEGASLERDLQATVITLESEFAFRHTKIAAEYVRDRIELADGVARPSGWFVQGKHAITPRWFAAGRFERMRAPGGPGSSGTQHFSAAESVLGYRVTRELTVRGGHRARRGFGASSIDHAATVSLAWRHAWR